MSGFSPLWVGDARSALDDLEELGEPIGEIKVTTGLSPWHHTSNRNAIAHGYLMIAADGDYTFGTDSFYDRNLLMIDGKLICEYADGAIGSSRFR